MKNLTKLSLSIFLLAIVLFTSCKKEYDSIETVDEAAIQAYIKANNLTGKMTRDSLGVYYQVLDAGSGSVIANRDSVLFSYEEKSITDATTFYSTSVNGNEGTYFGYLAGKFNDAWKTGLRGLKFGGKVRLLVPSRLAYGKNGNATLNVPSNAIIDTYITTSTYRKQWQWDDAKIQTYLAAKGLTATAIKDASRVYYITTTQGTGVDAINESSTVVYKYTGRLLDGTVFDSSTDGTFSTTFASIYVEGWKSIVKKYTAGAKFRMFIPSDLAYGTSGSTGGAVAIPSNAVLDFDIEIVSVTN
ncbi:FKBP-type peptidyl-prolyl cis-trans isomerase [Pedobacter rhodius]|uniref:Peptidyl-prolyl cis-trans isomerase n=1 Tax=Pedobacter rhodius TaxID=3004098 RepID=A0ABT4L1A5_9SPHI|nr:FKBP-type peptidyl-prolyl cis-trans isomerase [Pedobacter sp. SJ11]MCZ4224955.1 FKBP-type peptidyl-prolyl cis-trans isomerase [Pedobacter sp. SJ11]